MRFCLQLIQASAVLAALAATGVCAENKNPANSEPAAPHVVSVVRADARTGRLVRTVIVSPKATPAKAATDSEVRAWIEEAAKNFELSPLLVNSVIQVESNYNPFAISPKGAQGLMQLMPSTARRFGVKNTFDARENIEGGVRYLKFLQDTFQDDRLAIAAYNAGENAVAKYRGIPPYPETVNYVAKVGQHYGQAQRMAAKRNTEPKNASQTKPSDDEPRHVVAFLDAEGRLHIETQ
jgi:soluble lytic murein transglycosylase-like protein